MKYAPATDCIGGYSRAAGGLMTGYIQRGPYLASQGLGPETASIIISSTFSSCVMYQYDQNLVIMRILAFLNTRCRLPLENNKHVIYTW
jgi:hypothetical protein